MLEIIELRGGIALSMFPFIYEFLIVIKTCIQVFGNIIWDSGWF